MRTNPTNPILAQRRISGLSRAAVAKLSEGRISQRQLSRYEHEEIAPPLDKAVLLAEIFGCSLDAIAGRSEVAV